MLSEIERFTRQRLTPAKVPTRAHVAARRLALFKARILKTLEDEDLGLHLSLVESLAEESGRDMAEIAAATACLAQGDRPLIVPLEPEPEQVAAVEDGMVRLFIDAGRFSGMRPADIVGAIANEAGVPGKAIGAIDIYDDFTFVDVPAEYQAQVLEGMSGATIRGQAANIRLASGRDVAARAGRSQPPSRPPRGPQAAKHPYARRLYQGKRPKAGRPRRA
jgi:ATP-dependent RNA helicase DeaD